MKHRLRNTHKYVRNFALLCLMLLFANITIGQTPDGNLGTDEYGAGNAFKETGQDGKVYYMTWTDQKLFMLIEGVSPDDAVTVYFDFDAATPVNSGNGTQTGRDYDGITPTLPFNADATLYFKKNSSGVEYYKDRSVYDNAISAWGAKQEDYTVAYAGTNLEMSIEWTQLDLSGRPDHFNFVAYMSKNGATPNIWGHLPQENPNNSELARYFTVVDVEDAPHNAFENNSYCYLGGGTNFSEIDVYDFTMNKTSGIIERLTGDWNITNKLVVADGTVSFGNTGSDCNIKDLDIRGGEFTLGSSTGACTVKNVKLSGGTLTLSSQEITLNVTGDWENDNSGTFTADKTEVKLSGTDQTIKGDNDFYKLTKEVIAPATLTFEAGKKQTITNALVLKGSDATNKLSLRSTTDGTKWNIVPPTDLANHTVEYVDVKDSKNTGTTIYALNGSTDSGNNEKWVFNLEITLSSNPTPIEEGHESGAEITVTLTGDEFEATLDAGKFTFNPSLPNGITKTISRESDTEVKITLAGTADDYDADIVTELTVAADQLTNYNQDLTSTNKITFQAVVETNELTATPNEINEGSEGGTEIIIELKGGKKFVSNLTNSNWTWTYNPALPSGLSLGNPSRESDTEAKIILSGTAADYDTDVEMTLTVKEAEIDGGGTGDLTVKVSLKATQEGEALAVTTPAGFLEGAEDGKVLTVVLTGDDFISSIDTTKFALTGLPDGVGIYTITKTTDNDTVEIQLAGNRTKDFDSHKTITLTVEGSQFEHSSAALTATLTLPAVNDEETLSWAANGVNGILEGYENGEKITVTLQGGTFVSLLTAGKWALTGLPDGVAISNINKVDATHVEITLSGNRRTKFTADHDLTLEIAADQFDEYDTPNPYELTGIKIKKVETEKKTVLQAFWWDFKRDQNDSVSWANYLADLAPRIAALGFDAVWIPPTVKNAGPWNGYAPYDHYDLGDKYQKGHTETRIGTKDELLRMIAVMHANGLEVIQDVVLNHVSFAGADNGAGGEAPEAMGDNKWKIFRNVCFETPAPETGVETDTGYLARSGRWAKNWQNFHPHPNHNEVNQGWSTPSWGPDFCYGYFEDGTGNGFGQYTTATFDPVQESGYNRNRAREWIMWMKKQTDVDGFRWDAVKHFPHFVVQDLSYKLKYDASMGKWKGGEAMFNVGEYVDTDKANLDNYVDSVTNSYGGNDELLGTFDFSLRPQFNALVNDGGNYDLGNLVNFQQDKRWHYYDNPQWIVHRTVPFVNNHDTFRPELDGNGDYTTNWDTEHELVPHIEPNNVRLPLLYAFICAIDGNPQFFFEDVFNIGYDGNRFSHDPKTVAVRDRLENILWCHQNLDFKSGAYKVRNQSADYLAIERSGRAVIVLNDKTTGWENQVVQTDFAPGTKLHDYSGANQGSGATVTVGANGKVTLYTPPCSGKDGREYGYSIWAPESAQPASNYKPDRAATTSNEWEMANDLGDSHPLSLRQGGALPDNSVERRYVGRIFVEQGKQITYELTPEDATKSLTLSLWNTQGEKLDEVSGTGELQETYTATYTGWYDIKVRNTTSDYAGQTCKVRATYTAPKDIKTADYPAPAQYAFWNGKVSSDWSDRNNWDTRFAPNEDRNAILPDEIEKYEAEVNSLEAKVKDLRIAQERTLSVNPGGALEVVGDIENNGQLILDANANSNKPTGILIPKGNITNSGNMVFRRWISGGYSIDDASGRLLTNLHLVSSPVSKGTSDEYSENAKSIFKHLTLINNAVVFRDYEGELTVGEGYQLFNHGDFMAELTAEPGETFNKDDVDVDCFDAYDYYGWFTVPAPSFVGNPYPAPISIDSIDFSTSNLARSVALIGDGKYKYWNTTTKTGTATDGIVPAGNAFRVVSTANKNLDSKLTIKPKAMVREQQDFYKSKKKANNIIKLLVENTALKTNHEAVVLFRNDAKYEFDFEYDAEKLFEEDASLPHIYTYAKSGEKLAINALPMIDETETIPLTVQSEKSGRFVISAKEISLDYFSTVYLFDKETGIVTDLSQDDYAFKQGQKSSADRFYLQFTKQSVKENDLLSEKVKVYSYGKNICVANIGKNTQVVTSVYDLRGRELLRKVSDASDLIVIPTSFATGEYLVRVLANNKTTSKKVFIR